MSEPSRATRVAAPRGSEERLATLTIGHELFLTQFEAGESISEVLSIIRATLPVDSGVGTDRGLENAN